jgi:hypothetical protein
MSQRSKNEIDLLLRALGREARAEGSDSRLGEITGAHLDADELNAFAENVLPVSTRARYAAHLVDCSECRKIAAQLAQAAGVIQRPLPEKTPQNFWSYLGAFLSPAVLRYAVPALVLFVVAGIGLFLYQEQKQTQFVAQRTESEKQPAQSDSVPVSTVEPVDQLKSSNSQGEANSRAAATDTPTTKADEARKTRDDAPAKAEGASASDTITEERSDKTAAAAPPPQVTYAPEPQAQSGPPSRNAPVAQAEASREREEKVGRDQQRQRAEADEDKDFAGSSVSRAPAKRGVGGVRANEIALSKEKKAQSDVRSVGGRQFRRDGDTWIDTAYDGRATVVVKRGSEQYRALVADEPQLRSIAESFDGTVIVVWKGRGYRFH